MSAAADRDVQGALTTSFLFHGAILLALLFGLPHMKPEPLELVQPIPIDIVDVGPVTTTQVQGTGQVAKKNEMAPAPAAPKPAAAAPPPPKAKPVETKADDQAALSKLIKSESKKADKEKQEDKKDDQMFGSLLKNLSKQKPADTPAPADAKTPPAPAAAGSPGIVASKLTISEEDLLRRQIEQCWNVPTGSRDAKSLIIEIHLEVNPDRTVRSAEIVNTDQMSDPYFRAAAESARRAVLNPKCSPLQLPEDKADEWKSMTLRFNPQDVL